MKNTESNIAHFKKHLNSRFCSCLLALLLLPLATNDILAQEKPGSANASTKESTKTDAASKQDEKKQETKVEVEKKADVVKANVVLLQENRSKTQENSENPKGQTRPSNRRVIVHEHRTESDGSVNHFWQQQVIVRSTDEKMEYRFEKNRALPQRGPLPNPVQVMGGESAKGHFAKGTFVQEGHLSADVIVDPNGGPFPIVNRLPSNQFWLGVNCEPASGLIKSQFSIESGLAVVNVVPKGPADGLLLEHDIIVRFGEKKLNTVSDLVDNIQASGGEKIELQVIRKAEPIKIVVSARKRPEMKMTFAPIVLQTRTDNTIDQKQLEQFEAVVQVQDSPEDLPQLFVLRPGIQLGSATAFKTSKPSFDAKGNTFHEIPGVELESLRFAISSGSKGQTRIRVDSRLRGISDFKLVKPMWTDWMAEPPVKEYDEFASDLHRYKTRVRNLVIRLENEHRHSQAMLTRLSKKESGTPPEVLKQLEMRRENLEQQLKLRQVDLQRITSVCDTVQKDMTEEKK